MTACENTEEILKQFGPREEPVVEGKIRREGLEWLYDNIPRDIEYAENKVSDLFHLPNQNRADLTEGELTTLLSKIEQCINFKKSLKVGDKVKRNSMPLIASRDTEVPNNSQGVIKQIDGNNYTVNFDGSTRVLKVKELIKVSQGGGKKRKSKKRKYTRKKKKSKRRSKNR